MPWCRPSPLPGPAKEKKHLYNMQMIWVGHVTGPLKVEEEGKREAEGGVTRAEGQRGATGFEDRGRGHEPGQGGVSGSWKGMGNSFSPGASSMEGRHAANQY